MQPPDDDHNKGTNANLGIQASTLTSSRDMNIHVTQNQAPPKDAMEILKEHVAFGALFNSAERFDPPKCHPDTRKVVLAAINRWARDHNDGSKPILWLRGAAGAEKSAIAQTSSEFFHSLGLLAASFYFSRTAPGRNSSGLFIPTLAYQLSLSIPSTWPHIERALLRDVGLFKKTLQTQFAELIIGPLALAVASTSNFTQRVIVIDGLDECSTELEGRGHEARQREILDIISAYSEQADCPLRFLVASRPERQIRTSFSHPPLTTSSRTITLDDTQNPNTDIELFLNYSFEEIRHNHPYLRDSSWPPEGTIATLIQKSSGHFIYASTAARYLKRPRQDPRASLEAILNIQTITDAKDSPFAELDALYMLIMRSVVPESLPVVHTIFEIMCYPRFLEPEGMFSDCNYMSPVSLERYFFLPPGSLTYTHLVDLHSILEIPSENALKEAPIRFIHASFSEFLTNRSRSGSFCVELDEAVSRVLSIWLKHVFIQSLQPDFGGKLGYTVDGFTVQLVLALDGNKRSPPQGFVEGLAALVGEDKEMFADYVRSANLAHFGVERNCQRLENPLCEGWYPSDAAGIQIILAYLKEQGICNFKMFIEGYELRGGEIVCPETRPPLPPFPSPSLNQQYVGRPSGLDAPTPWDGHADEPSATTQADTYDISTAPPKPLHSNSKKRGREVDSPPTPVTASSSQRTTRSMAKSVANDGRHPQMGNPVSVVKARTGGKKELKQAAANSNQKRRR